MSEGSSSAGPPGDAFVEHSRRYLLGEYMPKIRRCLEVLTEDDLWWRPNPASNSVGNLLVHLAGNLRQWVVGGIGGEPDRRDRPLEFSAAGGVDRSGALRRLTEAVEDAERVLASLSADRLLERRSIQGYEVTVLGAVYHAVEHFAMHTGQIVYITKLRSGADLAFYEADGGLARPAW